MFCSAVLEDRKVGDAGFVQTSQCLPAKCIIFVSVNHKTEDEILRSLNRQAQRKVLTNLQDVRQEKCETAKATSASAEHLPER